MNDKIRTYWPAPLAAEVLGVPRHLIHQWVVALDIKPYTDKSHNGHRGKKIKFDRNQMQQLANMARFQTFTRVQLIQYITAFGG